MSRRLKTRSVNLSNECPVDPERWHAYTCCTRSCRICMLCSILTCMYRIYSRKKRTCGAHSVHKRIHLKDTAQQDQCYNNKIVIISHTHPATLKASKSKPLKRGCGTTAIPQTSHAFHSFHASFWGINCSTFKAASEKSLRKSMRWWNMLSNYRGGPGPMASIALQGVALT